MITKQKNSDNREILFGRCDFIINNPTEYKDCRYDIINIKSLEKIKCQKI